MGAGGDARNANKNFKHFPSQWKLMRRGESGSNFAEHYYKEPVS
jgi:hypothetical protein